MTNDAPFMEQDFCEAFIHHSLETRREWEANPVNRTSIPQPPLHLFQFYDLAISFKFGNKSACHVPYG